ncbi:MAG: zeta toxin family protein [Candidatus Limiplasma sp.]|nr:zeta toxin family protein [Candidatus Limiplasma sp.]
MSSHFGRTLHKDEEAQLFVEHILGIEDQDEVDKAIKLITDAECNLKVNNESTLNNATFRDRHYRDESERDVLRRRIVKELIEKPRVDDDLISLGVGGAAPPTEVKKDASVIYLIGPPASGKSSIANVLANSFGAYILDSDYAKRKLPEYNNKTCGASLVHDESDALIFTWSGNNLLKYCVKERINMVIPKIGHSLQGVCDFANRMRELDYNVYLVSIFLDRREATKRAYDRFQKSSRYVPLSLIFDVYANDPMLNYFRIIQKCKDCFNGYAQISTEGKSPTLVESINFPEIDPLFRRS